MKKLQTCFLLWLRPSMLIKTSESSFQFIRNGEEVIFFGLLSWHTWQLFKHEKRSSFPRTSTQKLSKNTNFRLNFRWIHYQFRRSLYPCELIVNWSNNGIHIAHNDLSRNMSDQRFSIYIFRLLKTSWIKVCIFLDFFQIYREKNSLPLYFTKRSTAPLFTGI